jgi:hypothetical protein
LNTTGWIPYQNNELSFSIKIPPYVSVDTLVKDKQLVIFKSDKENFDVRFHEDKTTTLDRYYYLDLPVSSHAILGGKEALIFKAEKGYCDGPDCSSPFIAYATKVGDNFYTLIFNGDTTMNEVEKTILSSFEFI